MYIKYSHFSLGLPVGNLSDANVDTLKQALTEYPEINRPSQHVITFRKGSSMLTVQPDLITFTVQGEASEINTEDISNELIKLKNLLNISRGGQVRLILEALENSSENIMENSKKSISEAANVLGAEGIGYRFLLNYTEFKGSALIEPYIEDKQKIFYYIDLYSVNSYQNEDIKAIFSQLFTLGTSSTREAAKKIFS